MALTKTDLINLYNQLYSSNVDWDSIGGHTNGDAKRIIALLLNILQAVDGSFTPVTGAGVNTPALTEYTSADGAVTLPAETYSEVSIFVTESSTGTIESIPVIEGVGYTFTAQEGKSLEEIDFEVLTGSYQVLTIAV